jgi:hypothetical protein
VEKKQDYLLRRVDRKAKKPGIIRDMINKIDERRK